MKPVVYNGHYIVNKDQMDFEHPVEIHFTRFGENQRPCDESCHIGFHSTDTFKVFCNFNEPTTSENTETTENVINQSKNYDLILTSRDEIIEKCDNAVFFPYGSTWLYKDIDHQDGIGFYHPSIDTLHENKTNDISFLITHHRGKEGYDLRHKVWEQQRKIKNKRFFSSTRNPVSLECLLPNDDKKELFKSKFSIIIESTKEENYFTEKICDALLAKTIPIYWGCPNIDDFFDPRGMIICNSAEEIIEACENLDYGFYDSAKKYVNDNFETAKKYCEPLSKRIESEIKRVLKPKPKQEKNIVLSVGILTVKGREALFNRLMDKIKSSVNSWHEHIEVIVSHDNKEKSVGTKRNEVLQKAKGKYVCFIDDDDMISDVYFDYIMTAIQQKPDCDCIGFNGMYYIYERPVMVFKHSSKFEEQRLIEHVKVDGQEIECSVQRRKVNHLNPVKLDIAKAVGFVEISNGEDSDYSRRLVGSGLLKSEIYIDEILYHYLFSPDHTETQKVTQ